MRIPLRTIFAALLLAQVLPAASAEGQTATRTRSRPVAVAEPASVTSPAARSSGSAAAAAAPAEVTLLGTPVAIGKPAVAAEVAAAAVEPAPEVEKAPAPEPAEKPAAKSAALEVANGTVKFSGLIQAWYQGAAPDVASTFRLRRAELKFAGEIGPRVGWTLMVDPAKALKVSDSKVSQGSLLLQDAFVTIGLGRFALDAGQMKLPLSYEGSAHGSNQLPLVERALFISEGKYGLVRDLGFKLSGRVVPGLAVEAGVFNGAGEHQNSVDGNDQKVLAARAVVTTPVPGLKIGASGAWGDSRAEAAPRQDRYGAEARLTAGGFTLQSEVMRGHDLEVERLGYYGLAAYRWNQVEGALRFDAWDPNVANDTDARTGQERSWGGGFNYYLAGSTAKAQVNWLRRTFADSRPDADLLMLNLQTSW